MKYFQIRHIKNNSQQVITRFKLTCPECGAAMIIPTPMAAVWELCSSCKHHVWDVYDAMMAEVYSPDLHVRGSDVVQADN